MAACDISRREAFGVDVSRGGLDKSGMGGASVAACGLGRTAITCE